MTLTSTPRLEALGLQEMHRWRIELQHLEVEQEIEKKIRYELVTGS